MRNNPFFSRIVSPQFGTRQKEESPVNVPFSFPTGAVGRGQDGTQRSVLPVMIHGLQPRIAGFFVMRSIDAPMLQYGKVRRKVQEQIVAGHGSAAKEIVTHPAFVKVVGEILVGENVDKETSRGWFQKPVDFGQQLLIILHVLKHFDRYDQVIVFYYGQGALIVRDVALQEVETILEHHTRV